MTRFPRITFRLLLASYLLLYWVLPAIAVDSDNDGRLDVLDVPQYNPAATGTLVLDNLGIEDLDGVSELSPELLRLYLGNNQITKIDQGDLTGLQTQYLFFYNNQISEIEPGAFAGLTLRDLNLNNNHFSDLHLEGGIYEVFYHLGIDRFDVKRLFLDDAQISEFSYEEVVRETTEITDLSMVGTTFLGDAPDTLQAILGAHALRNVTVDQNLFDMYSADFQQFASIPGNLLSVVNVMNDSIVADCNHNGELDFQDLHCIDTMSERDAVLSSLNLWPGDLDGNGAVHFNDFLILASNFGLRDRSYLEGNLNLDDTVAFADFLILAEHFGSAVSVGASVRAVPESNTIRFSAVGVVLAATRIRRRRRKHI